MSVDVDMDFECFDLNGEVDRDMDLDAGSAAKHD
jgi:hypothetical protein